MNYNKLIIEDDVVETKKKVFISYSWAVQAKVVELPERLNGENISIIKIEKDLTKT